MANTNCLTDDVWSNIKPKLTVMGRIGLERVNTFFLPTLPVSNAKPPKISMRIKDVSSGQKKPPDQRFILLILRDMRKKGEWTVKLRLTELKERLAKVFIRIKSFHSLRICVANEDALANSASQESNTEKARKKAIMKREAFAMMISGLSSALIGAASSFQSSITIQRLFFPPHSTAMTTLLDDAYKLISFLSPSLVQLRLSTNHSDDVLANPDQCQHLWTLIGNNCTRLQKLKIGGACGNWKLFKDCLESLTSLCHLEHLALDTEPCPLRGLTSGWWFILSFLQFDSRLKHLSISYKMLTTLVEPGFEMRPLTVLTFEQLKTLDINFDYYYQQQVNEQMISDWIASEERDVGQSVLSRALTIMSEHSQLSLTLNCAGSDQKSSAAGQTNATSLAKTVLKVAATVKKRIRAKFLHCFDMLKIIECLKNEYPLLEVEENSGHGFTIRDGPATCAFSN